MTDILTWSQAQDMLRDYPPRFQVPPNPPPARTFGPNECPMCGYPKGTPGFKTAFVPITHPLFGRLIQCPACWDGRLPDHLLKLSGLSGKMLAWSLESMISDTGRKAARRAARSFCRNPSGWLTLWGSYGVGKTYVLAGIVNEMRRQEKAAMYVVAPDLLDALRDTYNPGNPDAFNPYFDKVKNIPILALDELGQVRMTEWALEKLFQLLDYRLRHASTLGTIISLHFEPKASAAPAGWPEKALAILSRTFEANVIHMTGGDVRPMTKRAAA